MSFTFNDNIPAAQNNPSNDQPIMLNNNRALQAILPIDHIGFNNANGGQHKAITFNQDASYVPTSPVSPPKLFTNTVSGLPQLFYYSGTAAQGANQYTIASNFSTFLFGGMILKGGFVNTAAGANSFTYAALTLADFPNNTLAVITQPRTGSGSTVNVSAISATGFSITGASAGTYYFLAIGY